MQDAFRQRLSSKEVEDYDLYDSRAALCSYFVVWPGIAGLMCYAGGRPHLAIVCAVIVALAIPGMLFFARRARRLRELAEERYLAIVSRDDVSES